MKASPIVTLGLMLAVAACNASTAHLDPIQAGKDKDITTATTAFGANDTIYLKSHAGNLPNKVTLTWHVVAENVKGVQPNFAIPSLDRSTDMDADGDATYNLTPPSSGWPPGTYKITLTMMDEGTQRDQKSLEFTTGS